MNYVQVNIDPEHLVMEPTYHLILRNAGLIQGSHFSHYSASLAPLTDNLPYFVLAAAVLSFIIVSIIFVVQYIYRAFK